MELFETKEVTPQARLRERLLSADISPSDFISELEDLDQSTPDRNHAMQNLTVLEDPKVAAVFQSTSESQRYHGFLSFTCFHRAQIRLHSDTSEGVIDDLEKSLDNTRREESDDTSWVAYVTATLAYMQGDIETLKSNNELLTGTKNQWFTKSFIKGLEERGAPDYVADYNNPIKD